jgi:hypothetical protein
MTKTLLIRLLLPIAVAATLGVSPAAASATEGAVVPPSNSAAAQYTEAFPTSGGEKKTDQAPRHRSPSKVLGGKKAHKLEQQGPDGRAAAEAAAATAPNPLAPAPSSAARAGAGSSAGHDGSSGESHPAGSAANRRQSTWSAVGINVRNRQAAQATGSSGLGSAIGQATGLSSSGQSGILLLLILLATILWSLGYLWQQRQRVG